MYWVMLGFILAGYAFVGVLVNAGFRRYPKISCFVFVALPIFLIPFWFIEQEKTDWFIWAKMYAILAGTWLILAVRTTSIKEKKWPFYLLYAIGWVNFIEAILRTFSSAWEITNIVIGLSGFLLIALLPRPHSISVAPGNKGDLLWPTPYSWIIGYTIWDAVFVSLVFPLSSLVQIPLLAAPVISSLRNPKLYIQARGCTLSFFLMVAIAFPITSEIVYIEDLTNYWVLCIGATVAALWIGLSALRKKNWVIRK